MPPQIVKVTKPKGIGLNRPPSENEDIDTEAFMLRDRSEQDLADYDAGFKVGIEGGSDDATKSIAWQRGWAEAQE
jgi:hypothetical protein